MNFFMIALSCKNTYSVWSRYIEILIVVRVSKVSLWKRMNTAQLDCLRCVLEETFKVNLMPITCVHINHIVSSVHLQMFIFKTVPMFLCRTNCRNIIKGVYQKASKSQACVFKLYTPYLMGLNCSI